MYFVSYYESPSYSSPCLCYKCAPSNKFLSFSYKSEKNFIQLSKNFPQKMLETTPSLFHNREGVRILKMVQQDFFQRQRKVKFFRSLISYYENMVQQMLHPNALPAYVCVKYIILIFFLQFNDPCVGIALLSFHKIRLIFMNVLI